MDNLSKGLGWAGHEHRWERYTNMCLFIGIVVCGCMYYYKMDYFGEAGLFFLVLSGFVHLVARLCHMGEQHYLRDSRKWR